MYTEGSTDLMGLVIPSFFMAEAEQKKQLDLIKQRALNRYFPVYEKALENQEYLVGRQFSIADVQLLEVILAVEELHPVILQNFPNLQTVKTSNKVLGVSLLETDLLRKSWPQGTFIARAQDVINNIGKLKDFYLEHRKDYINVCSHTFMRTCSDAIQQLRTEESKNIVSSQVKEHRNAILDLIGDYLKRVCNLYS
ncbi:hypothetical protein AB205_0109460, partial [Aquarana catesbeiana]